jgi:hypothetical protein
VQAFICRCTTNILRELPDVKPYRVSQPRFKGRVAARVPKFRSLNYHPIIIMSTNKGWIDTIVSGAGNVVGGAANAVGNGISTAGRSAGNGVSGVTRNWADSLRRLVFANE